MMNVSSVMGGASTDHQEEEDTSAEVEYLLQKQIALRKAIELRDTARQVVEDAKGTVQDVLFTHLARTPSIPPQS